jgi:hypothetical protein
VPSAALRLQKSRLKAGLRTNQNYETIMKKRNIFAVFTLTLLFVSIGFAQKGDTKKITSQKAIFAVLNDGKTLEPIAFIEKGKLKEIHNAGTPEKPFDFVKAYYKPKNKLNLIFAGANAGTATVVKDFKDSDCAGNQAEISVVSSKVKPKGNLMALATDAIPMKNAKLQRKLPTAAERTNINELVMKELITNKVPIKNTGELRYHNLTKLDVDGDGLGEFVGTYWYNSGAKKRSLLFFIAESDKNGLITIGFNRFQDVEEENVMSGDVKDVDNGIYHELLLDMFDYDGDGQNEIFTISSGFEGSNFNVYKRVAGKWTQVLETSNYHCGY